MYPDDHDRDDDDDPESLIVSEETSAIIVTHELYLLIDFSIHSIRFQLILTLLRQEIFCLLCGNRSGVLQFLRQSDVFTLDIL